ncbi:sortase domain-containing protein [Lacticaseibacillus sp. N501-2]|uniref:sortase domain-containing protein n=1 Tax=Lacticaseibacillus salsurae TaxID=3367729 RepID=UPI0038B2EFF1
MFKNRIFGLAAIIVVASGLGVVTVTAHAGNAPVSTSRVSATAKSKATQSTTSHKAAEKKATAKKMAVKASESSQAAVASAKASSTKAASAKASSAKASSVAASTSSVKAAASSQAAASQSTSSASTTSASSTAQSSSSSMAVRTAAVQTQTPAQRAQAKAASIQNATGETYVGTISGLGHSTDVVLGSMSRTSAPAQAGLAMTWGGATRLSTTDGLTTEIAGHAKSNTFAWIMSLGVGSQVTVTDANGNARTYTVYARDDVNDQSYSTKTGKDQWNAITSAGQGEAVVLQTCISNTVNRIVWAH